MVSSHKASVFSSARIRLMVEVAVLPVAEITLGQPLISSMSFKGPIDFPWIWRSG
jgi:hypothetical protein